MFLVLIVAASAAASGNLVLLDELVSLAPGEVKAVNLGLNQKPAVVDASFEVIRGEDLTIWLRPERSPRILRALSERRSGNLRHAVREPGEYQLVLDNRGEHRGNVRVRLRVELAFDVAGVEEPIALTAQKRALVVGASLLFLGLLSVWFGSRLRPAIERRRRGEPPRLY